MSEQELPDYLAHRERIKNKYKAKGKVGFVDYEILELLLTYAIPRKDVKPIAKQLIKQFGSLKKVFDEPIENLKEVKGIGDNSAILINLVKDFMSLYLEPEKEHKVILSSPEAVSSFIEAELNLNIEENLNSYLRVEFGNQKREFFMILCLNSANQLIHKEVLFSGTLDQAQVYPREIIKIALLKNASAIILVHNHPSGNSKPSRDDIVLTEKIEEISKEFGLRVHDHIVVSQNHVFSIKANRFLS